MVGDEPDLQRQVTGELLAILDGLGATKCLVPLALGGHADHVLTRDAATAAASASAAVTYYEDLPYARELSAAQTRMYAVTVARFARPIKQHAKITVGEKCDLARIYATQCTTEVLDAIAERSRELVRPPALCEQLWVVPQASADGKTSS